MLILHLCLANNVVEHRSLIEWLHILQDAIVIIDPLDIMARHVRLSMHSLLCETDWSDMRRSLFDQTNMNLCAWRWLHGTRKIGVEQNDHGSLTNGLNIFRSRSHRECKPQHVHEDFLGCT